MEVKVLKSDVKNSFLPIKKMRNVEAEKCMAHQNYQFSAMQKNKKKSP